MVSFVIFLCGYKQQTGLLEPGLFEKWIDQFSNRTKPPHLHWTSEESLNIADFFYRILFFTLKIVSFLGVLFTFYVFWCKFK